MENKNLWIFDLDNTLYSPNCGMFDYLNNRINFYMIDRININIDEVNCLRNRYFKEYGSTMIGLIKHHKVDADEFLKNIHGIDVSVFLKRNEDFVNFFKDIPGTKIIITNSPLFYAQNVIIALGLESYIERIYDIKFMDYIGKPHLVSINKILSKININKNNTFFIDDTIENIISAKYLGLKTIYVNKESSFDKIDYYNDYLIPQLKRFI